MYIFLFKNNTFSKSKLLFLSLKTDKRKDLIDMKMLGAHPQGEI